MRLTFLLDKKKGKKKLSNAVNVSQKNNITHFYLSEYFIY